MNAGPVTLVTGGSGLVGRACIEALAARGHTCVALDPVVPSRRAPTRETIRCDVSSEADVTRAVARVRQRYGRADAFVHSPSVQPPGFGADLPTYDLSVWRRVLDVHVTGAMLMARALVPLMARRRSGSIVFLGSIYGVVAPRFALYGEGQPSPPLAYSASKAALVGMARWIAARYARLGIRCNIVSPGGIDESRWPAGGFKQRYLRQVPSGRAVNVDDVARAIVYAVEAEHLTGHNLVLDGGWTCV